MAVSVLRRSSSFARHYFHRVKRKTRVTNAAFNFSTDSPEKEETEDFFGIPSSYKLQQKRLSQVDLEVDSSEPCSRPAPRSNSFNHQQATRSRSRSSQQSEKKASPQKMESDLLNTNLFDEQYFEGALEIEQQRLMSRSSHPAELDLELNLESSSVSDSAFSVSPHESRSASSDHVNFIEEQYFGSHQTGTGSDIHSLNNIYGLSDAQEIPQIDMKSLRSMSSRSSSKIHPSEKKATQIKTSHTHHTVTALKSSASDVEQSNVSQRLRNPGFVHQQHQKEPVMAHDVAVKLRHELRNKTKTAPEHNIAAVNLNNSDNLDLDLNLTSTSESGEEERADIGHRKRDSKGYRILSDQLRDLDKMTTSDILVMLRRKIIFDHEDFLAIDKPYGLCSAGNSNDRLSLTNLLPRLCKILPSKYNASDLHLVQGLDRDVTGAVILAKNEESAYLLKGMFDSSEIIQRFWAITKGVPNQKHGIVDIPIGEAKVGNIYKMVLRPLYINNPELGRRTSKSHSYEAVTDFKVLASHQEAALVECQPIKKLVRHQIRVHLSNGLNTPILGDHKYSHFSKLAPQKLNRSTLELLHIRQAKVRHLALHLHCHTLVIPHYKSKPIFIHTKLPPHFLSNMKSLKLSERRHK